MSVMDSPRVGSFRAVPGERLLNAALRERSGTGELGPDAPVESGSLAESLETVGQEVDNRLRSAGQGLTISVKEARILDEQEGWFGGRGEIYVLTAVIDGSGEQPTFTTKVFEEVRSGDMLPLGEGGMLVGLVKNPTWFVDFHMLVMESDSDIRELGKALGELKESSGLNDAISLVGGLAALDPTGISQVTTAASILFTGVAAVMKRNGDDPVGTVHDFYLSAQGYGAGRHPSNGRTRWGDAEVAYQIDVTDLGEFGELEQRLEPVPGL
jgi:hypothetical protein